MSSWDGAAHHPCECPPSGKTALLLGRWSGPRGFWGLRVLWGHSGKQCCVAWDLCRALMFILSTRQRAFKICPCPASCPLPAPSAGAPPDTVHPAGWLQHSPGLLCISSSKRLEAQRGFLSMQGRVQGCLPVLSPAAPLPRSCLPRQTPFFCLQRSAEGSQLLAWPEGSGAWPGPPCRLQVLGQGAGPSALTCSPLSPAVGLPLGSSLHGG